MKLYLFACRIVRISWKIYCQLRRMIDIIITCCLVLLIQKIDASNYCLIYLKEISQTMLFFCVQSWHTCRFEHRVGCLTIWNPLDTYCACWRTAIRRPIIELQILTTGTDGNVPKTNLQYLRSWQKRPSRSAAVEGPIAYP